MSAPASKKAREGEGAAAPRDAVTIALADHRSYPVVFAAVADLGRVLEECGLRSSSSKRAALVSNSVVGKLPHRAAAEDALRQAGWDVTYVEILDGCVRGAARRGAVTAGTGHGH